MMKDFMNELILEKGVSRDKIKTDSRDILEGDIFIAIKGADSDGHKFISEALKKGAGCVICERNPSDLKKDYCSRLIIVEDSREAISLLYERIPKNPSKKLKVYGVTGTNGKTTTVFIIDSILKCAGIKTGLISTVYTRANGEELLTSKMTTPGITEVYTLLDKMVGSGKTSAVLEISSHALSQKRIRGIKLESAVFTNITSEHMDYHGNMENYLTYKLKIFDFLKENGTAVLNIDDPLIGDNLDQIKSGTILTTGLIKNADIMAKDIELSDKGTEFTLDIKNKGYIHISSGLIGKHNVYNMLSAVGALINTGISLELIKKGLENAPLVPGRLERVISNAPFQVFIDYAHTPNALENVLQCLRLLTDKRLICVFGCGGDRDRLKRPEMGKIAEKMCDFIILTNDNPRTEEPERIITEIEKGVNNTNIYSIIPDRKTAISRAINSAKEGDIILIAGKGHENYQIVGNECFHFDDKEAAGHVLSESGY